MASITSKTTTTATDEENVITMKTIVNKEDNSNDNDNIVMKDSTQFALSSSSSWKRSRELFDNNNTNNTSNKNNGTNNVLVPTLVEDILLPSNNNNNTSTSTSTSTSTTNVLTKSTKYNSNPYYYINLHDSSIQRRRRMKLQQLGISSNDSIQLAPFPLIGDNDATTGSATVSSNNQQLTLYNQNQFNTKTGTTTKTAPVVSSAALALLSPNNVSTGTTSILKNDKTSSTSTGSVLLSLDGSKSNISSNVPIPQWHSPWKLSTVLSSHLGWVRCIAMSPDNSMFATGAADRTIKIWNLPKACVGSNDSLQLTLTGHISPVRSIVFSPRHPYLFTCGEDKTVKCWDLETNQVVRHYHGHLSGVYSLSLHPILDVLVSAGRDAVGRVWDIRTKRQIHLLSGHDHTISTVVTKSTHPQVITSSHDCTIKLWDLAAGKCFTTLTHHNKAIRSLALPSFENTFISGSTDYIKKWQGKDGKFLHNISPLPTKNDKDTSSTTKKYIAQRDVICHTVSVNDDGVIVSGYDDGTIQLYDYNTGYNYQTIHSIVQPGSLQQAENAVLTSCFDLTGTRLITGEADKSIKIYKQLPTSTDQQNDNDIDDNNTISTNATTSAQYASDYTHPINIKAWRKQYIASLKERY